MSSGSTLNEKVLTAQSADETASAAVHVLPYTQILMLVEWGAGTSAGSVTLEAAPYPAYAGTWMIIGASAFVAASSLSRNAGALTPHCWPYVRARIDTAVVGGTVDVWIAGN